MDTSSLIHITALPITLLPNGTLICYRKKLYFVSEGLDARIVTGTNGMWHFLHDLNWKSYYIVYTPEKGEYNA